MLKDLYIRPHFHEMALVNRCNTAGLVVKSKEVKLEIGDAYVENLPLHEQEDYVR